MANKQPGNLRAGDNSLRGARGGGARGRAQVRGGATTGSGGAINASNTPSGPSQEQGGWQTVAHRPGSLRAGGASRGGRGGARGSLASGGGQGSNAATNRGGGGAQPGARKRGEEPKSTQITGGYQHKGPMPTRNPIAPDKNGTRRKLPQDPTTPQRATAHRIMIPSPSSTISTSVSINFAGSDMSTIDDSPLTTPDRLSPNLADSISAALDRTIHKHVNVKATYGIIAYSAESGISSSSIAKKLVAKEEERRLLKRCMRTIHLREVLTQILTYAGFRAAAFFEPELWSPLMINQYKFLKFVRDSDSGVLVADFVRFLTTTPVFAGTITSVPSTQVEYPSADFPIEAGSTPVPSIDGHALLALLNGGTSQKVAQATRAVLNDTVHQLSFQDVSAVARCIRRHGLAGGFSISIDTSITEAASAEHEHQVDSTLTLAAGRALITVLNQILGVEDITHLTPAELSRLSGNHTAGTSTRSFHHYLQAIRADPAYKADPYIKRVEEWTISQHEEMMAKWCQKMWDKGGFTNLQAQMEKKINTDDFNTLKLEMRQEMAALQEKVAEIDELKMQVAELRQGKTQDGAALEDGAALS